MPTLYVVATPIGNLGDMTPRAIETLQQVSLIAAEDTRVTVKLLNYLGFSKPMVAYFEHNKKERGNVVIDRILQGETCAIVTDAGMPAISDPGEDLIRECHEQGILVESVPGPTAFATALALSGMPSGRFCFEGFLSVNKPSRKQHLQEVKNERRTLIFYEAPHKLIRTLDDMYEVFGERKIAIVREITKIHETVMRTSLSEAIEYYKDLLNNTELTLETKQEYETKINELISAMSTELSMETMIKSKGFSEALVSYSDTYINVIVKSAELNESEVAQIVEVVQSQSDNRDIDFIKIIPVE